ncbi:MAG: hypothetical protein KBD56_08645 [Candidatus Eisenbacteria bacterium]|nr:hypothetical protein [Candidatus Eisenbacteria bacterium]
MRAAPLRRWMEYWAGTITLVPGCAAALALGLILGGGCARTPRGDAEAPRSQSYVGHDGERDTPVLVAAYPQLTGTRLDDCQTCHRGGEVTVLSKGAEKTRHFDPCAYCHLLSPESRIPVVAGGPVSGEATLNAFGAAYAQAGRSVQALRAIEREDSDGDGFANGVEIAANRYPGDAQSTPGQRTVPVRAFAWDDVTAMPNWEQLVLLNSHTQAEDAYTVYGGVRILDLLDAAGVDWTIATRVSAIAPDGYTIGFDVEAVREPLPKGRYYAGLDRGPAGFMVYPPDSLLPEGLVDGGEIPGDPFVLLAYANNGRTLEKGRLDPDSQTLEGEGPYRLIVPQGLEGEPGAPDRGSSVSPSGFSDGYDYDPAKEHNAGSCVRSVIAIRVDPLPDGFEEFDWKNGGYALLENRKIIVYGAGIGGR